MEDPILKLKAVGKRFPGVVALRGVSLEIARGEAHVLLGENGAGKSTLINLLGGLYPADDGEITFDGKPYRPRTPTDAYRAGIRVVHQELSMLSHMTVAENLLFESLPQRHGLVNYRETNRRAAALLEEVGLNVAPTTVVSRLGVAQMQQIEIAKALCYESKLLILDEPTASLTSKEVERLFEILRRLKARRVTILYISHRLHEIYEIGDRVTVLRDGQLVATRPLAGLMIPQIVQMMVGRSIRDEHAFRENVQIAGEALRVEGLRRNAKSPEVSFRVGKGEIVGVAGLVGSGRTETARALFGADPKIAGDFWVEGERVEISSPREAVRAGLCLMTEDRKGQGLLLGMSCAENITITDLRKISSHGVLERDVERGAADQTGRGASHQDAVDRPDGAQFLRRQPAEGGDRQMAVSGFEGPPLRRADARHRRRRQGGNLRSPMDSGRGRPRRPLHLVRTAGADRHLPPHYRVREGEGGRRGRESRVRSAPHPVHGL